MFENRSARSNAFSHHDFFNIGRFESRQLLLWCKGSWRMERTKNIMEEKEEEGDGEKLILYTMRTRGTAVYRCIWLWSGAKCTHVSAQTHSRHELLSRCWWRDVLRVRKAEKHEHYSLFFFLSSFLCFASFISSARVIRVNACGDS